MEDDQLRFDEGIRKFTLPYDPWEAQLIPMEPVPEFYDTFEGKIFAFISTLLSNKWESNFVCTEFEAAFQMWASLVAEATSLVPPHPSQLSDLLLLPTAQEVTFYHLSTTNVRVTNGL